jgi:hypothetical protein
MTKEHLKGAFAFGSCMGVLGFILLFYSVSFGTSRAQSWLEDQGGANTEQYQMIIESYIQTFIVTGGILFAFGLLLSSYAFYKSQK